MTLGLFVAVVVATCGSPAGQQFRTELPSSDHNPMPAVLNDETGLVTGIEPAEPGPDAGVTAVVAADVADPGAFILSWEGGLCDSDAALFFRAFDSRYSLHVEVHGGGTNCPAMAVRRGVRVKTSSPIHVESIFVTGGG